MLAVKGSGGDLGTMTVSGLALLDLDRVRALERVHAAGVHEDDIVAYYEYCRFGHGGAVPSIDTPLHAFVAHDHVDHLHPDSMIALARRRRQRARSSPSATATTSAGWRGSGRVSSSVSRFRDFQRAHPDARGAVLEGHGMICWADTSDECEALSLELIARAERFLADRRPMRAFGSRARRVRRPARPRASRAGPPPWPRSCRGVAASERPMVGAFSDAPVVLDFLSREAAPRLAALGTSCPDHFLRTKVRPLFLDLPGDGDARRAARPPRANCTTQYRADYRAYYDAYADDSSPPMRGADPVIVLVPGVGMWSFGADPQTARVAGEFYINAINVMRGAEAVSSYTPIDDHEKFRIEYWELEERKLRMRPAAPALQGRVALVTGGGVGHRPGDRRAAVPSTARASSSPTSTARAPRRSPPPSATNAVARLRRRRHLRGPGRRGCSPPRPAASAASTSSSTTPGFATAAALVDTTVESWDRLHAVLARGSFLVEPRRRPPDDRPGHRRRHRLRGVEERRRRRAAERRLRLGQGRPGAPGPPAGRRARRSTAIRVNGVNPDGVVQGSGIFQGEWLRQRADTYGVAPEDLGKYYAGRTLLGREVLPEHVADAVVVLVGGHLSRTTGLTIPVDGGVAAAFLR